MKLFYRELGEGEPLIILHGVFGSADNWLTVSKELAANFKLYLLDQRNHGQSPKSDEFNYSVMAEDLKEFIADHSIKNPTIIGHSMGGKVVMKFASLYPDLLKKLVVVDISPRYYHPHHQSILKGLLSLNLKELKTRQEADEQLAAYIPELGVRQFLLKSLYRNQDNEFAWRINLPVINSKIENIGEAQDENIRISLPALFIKGSESDYIEQKDEELIYKIFTNVVIKTVQGSGHWVQAEKPKEFLEALKPFLLN